MADPEYGTVVVTKRTSATTTTETEPQVGEHVISTGLVRLNREWQPKDKAAQRFKDDLIKKVEQVLNNSSAGSGSGGGGSPGVEPDLFYDTGYFYVTASTDYDKTHNLGQVPTRFTIFYSNVLNPDPSNVKHVIQLIHAGAVKGVRDTGGGVLAEQWTGITIRMIGQNAIKVHTTEKITGNDANAPASGHLRILMWR